MEALERVPLDRQTLVRCGHAVQSFTSSEVGGRAKLLFATLFLLLLCVNGLNVVNSYVGRDFFTAIEQRRMGGFVAMALVYVVVFAASTIVAAIYRFTEERLALLWREWLSKRLVDTYLAKHSYFRLKQSGELQNPDQRIAEDTRAFTTTTLSFVLMLLNASLTILAFAGVLWSISPLLFGVALGYAGTGSILTVLFGRPLIWLNYNQSDKEAAFRADLIHVRENAESVAILGREGSLKTRLHRRIDDLVGNAKRLIAVNRNLSFFTIGYNYLIQIIPALIVAPMFIRGHVEFGEITQSSMAFSQLLGAFSLVVTQFQSISAYAAVIARLNSLTKALAGTPMEGESPIDISIQSGVIAFDHLTLREPGGSVVLVDGLVGSMPRHTCVLVLTANDNARHALFEATAGIWDAGEGRIVRPPAGEIVFLPERPYHPPGDLRSVLLPGEATADRDERIVGVLRQLGIETIVARADGLGAERDWGELLSLREQQLLACAHAILTVPQFVVLDGVLATEPSDLVRVLELFRAASITYCSFGLPPVMRAHHDAVLEIAADGSWAWTEHRNGEVS